MVVAVFNKVVRRHVLRRRHILRQSHVKACGEPRYEIESMLVFFYSNARVCFFCFADCVN